MKAALLDNFGNPLRVGDTPRPLPLPDEVLVRVEACGVCHSDLQLARGDWPHVKAKTPLPAILGHEAVGRVVGMGREARGVEPGDRVGVGWLYSTCGACEQCADGAENLCLDRKVTGIAAPGGFAEFLRIRASHAIRIPDALAPEQAAPFFCAGLTVYHACKKAEIHAGQRVAVFGIGGLGHLAVQLAVHAGAEVTAVDVSDAKLDFARRLGARRVVHAAAADAAKQLAEGNGPHVAMVTAPSKSAYDLAFRTLRRRGTLAVVGIPDENLSFHADDMVIGEFKIVGSAVGTRQEIREVLALAAAGKLRCAVETRVLADINDVFARMQRGEILGRVVLKME